MTETGNSFQTVPALTAEVVKQTGYSHTPRNLDSPICKMAQSNIGTNLVPLLRGEQKGQFGSRLMASNTAKYLSVKRSAAAQIIFPSSRKHLLTMVNDVEPLFYLPLLPPSLFNGGRGMAPRHEYPSFSIKDLVGFLIDYIENPDQKRPQLIPQWPGYKGIVKRCSEKNGKMFTLQPSCREITGKSNIYTSILTALSLKGELLEFDSSEQMATSWIDTVISLISSKTGAQKEEVSREVVNQLRWLSEDLKRAEEEEEVMQEAARFLPPSPSASSSSSPSPSPGRKRFRRDEQEEEEEKEEREGEKNLKKRSNSGKSFLFLFSSNLNV